MAIIKEWRCDNHGAFEHALPLCPTCKKISRRVFLTPPRIGSVRQSNINRILDDVLPAQNLSNYTNATGYPKPTFSSIYTNDSGMSAGWGLGSLPKLVPGASPEMPLAKFDLNTGQRTNVNLASVAASLPQAVTVNNGSKIGGGGTTLRSRAIIERRFNG